MKQEIREQRTPLRMRTAMDANGTKYELQEWREMVSVNGSPWEPRQGHGQYMTLDGKPLERITNLQWETNEAQPVRLTLLE